MSPGLQYKVEVSNVFTVHEEMSYVSDLLTGKCPRGRCPRKTVLGEMSYTPCQRLLDYP